MSYYGTVEMKIRVGPQFFYSGGKQTFDIEHMTVMMGDRIVGKITDISTDYTEIDIIDPIAIAMIKSGINNSSVSMGCRVDGVENDISDNKNKVKSDACGHIVRLRELGVSEK